VGVFFRREVVLGNQLWGDGGFGHWENRFENTNLNYKLKTKSFAAIFFYFLLATNFF
jgi:hypothetical protein